MLEKERFFALHPAMRHLERAIYREIYLEKIVALSFLLAGLCLAGYAYPQSVFLSILGLFFFILGAGLGSAPSVRQMWKSRQHPLMQLLLYHPKRIVWVYSVATQLMPFGVQIFRRGRLYFLLEDGSEHSISVPAKLLKLISRTLNRLLPQASFGYSEERQELFLSNPGKLRRKE